MSRDWQRDVHDFHEALCPDQIGHTPNINHDHAKLRFRLITEEIAETRLATHCGNLAGVADGLGDLIYVAIGTAVAFGIDLRPVWDAIHAANMAKAGGEKRQDGKRLKPPGWTPPDIQAVLDRQGPLQKERP